MKRLILALVAACLSSVAFAQTDRVTGPQCILEKTSQGLGYDRAEEECREFGGSLAPDCITPLMSKGLARDAAEELCSLLHASAPDREAYDCTIRNLYAGLPLDRALETPCE